MSLLTCATGVSSRPGSSSARRPRSWPERLYGPLVQQRDSPPQEADQPLPTYEASLCLARSARSTVSREVPPSPSAKTEERADPLPFARPCSGEPVDLG